VNKNSTNNLTDFASWGETPAEVRLDPISPGRVRDSRRDAQLLTERGFRALRLSRVLSDGGGPVANPFPVRACCSLSEKIPMGGAVCCTNAETIIHDPESTSDLGVIDYGNRVPAFR
jgi:hypothetical protein